MTTNIRTCTRILAASTALAVSALGATTAASAAPGNARGQEERSSHAQSQGTSQGKSEQKPASKPQGSDSTKPDRGGGRAEAPGQQKQEQPATGGKSDGKSGGKSGGKGQDGKAQGGKPEGKDPAGNNGTVKITPHGEVDGIPQNTPHVGCVFDVEWYGFDEGDDIISDVTFEAWAPTRLPMTVDGPAQVFVGGDPASGAGTDSGFDGEATYRLSFDGEPHPQQGYHVKLTIHTPGSQGADTKHKVFWVEDCETETPETPDSPDSPDNPDNPETPDTPGTPEVEGEQDVDTPEVEGEQGVDTPDEGNDIEVAGEQGVAPQGGATPAVEQAAVPSAVDAGIDAGVTAARWVGTPGGLFVALLGLLTLAAGLLLRRRGA